MSVTITETIMETITETEMGPGSKVELVDLALAAVTKSEGERLGREQEQRQEQERAHERTKNAVTDGEPEPPPEEERSGNKVRTVAVMAGLFSAVFIVSLNQTLVATAIPTITADLHSASGYSWIGGAYLLGTATTNPVWAKLSDIFGRKPILLTAVGIYFVASIICAVATSMEGLIAGRGLQGIAGGGLLQIVMIIVSDLFSLRTRTLYMALLSIVWVFSAGIGPVLGGAFTEYLTWRWAFWTGVIISGLAFTSLFFFLDVHNPRTPMIAGIKAIDWFGSASMLGSMVMVLLALNFGGVTFPWNSTTVICLFVFGAAVAVFFVYSQMRLAKYPIMPIKLFTNWSNVACFAVGFLHDTVYIAVEYYLPLYFQSVREATPLTSGLLILPVTITEALVGLLAGMIVHRTGRYIELIYAGVSLLTLGSGLYIYLDETSPLWQCIVFQIVEALGAGLLFQPPLIALQAMVSQEDTATATGTLGFFRGLSTACSVVIGGVIFQNGMEAREGDLRNAGLPSEITEKLSGASAAANVMVVSTIKDGVQKMVAKKALAGSVRGIWIFCTAAAAAGGLASLFIRRRELSKEHVETKTGLKKE